MEYKKKIVIIAGPNGSGKTTFAVEFLPNEAGCPIFINADLIAAGLSPFSPEAAAVRAGKLMLKEIKAHLLKGESFAFETTLSGRGYARMIPDWQSAGYRVSLMCVSLPSVKMSIGRVATRVSQCGHNVSENVIKRRFVSGLNNFHEVYKSLVDVWVLYDNSQNAPILLEKGGKK